jgi:3-hydroxyanthranilate 3,4-dioxygenase
VYEPINFPEWIKANEHLLQPPVNNKQLFTESKNFVIMIVGGPNQRTDYHVDPYEEYFYQIRGNMRVELMLPDGPKTVHIREGEMWLLPGDTPHSPQRPEAGSIGLVVERPREEGVLEKFQWYCPSCHNRVHEVELQVRDIVADLPPVFNAFYADEQARTCKVCGAVHPGKG